MVNNVSINNTISLIPLGGTGDVTRNMYLYEYRNSILIVDCGLGFADETMLGVDLLLPDITYLLQTNKKIEGMFLTHGHEDHIGALPFLLSSLLEKNKFSIFATPLTSALANRKLKEFGVSTQVIPVSFENPKITIGPFQGEFIRVTHSVPDTSHIFIQTPVGNFYHGSDFKFDETPWDTKVSDYQKIEEVGKKGVLCLLSDCLGTERKGKTPSETSLYATFEQELQRCIGKCIITTYSSHIARLNQILKALQKTNRKVCFIGRSLVEIKDLAMQLGYLQFDKTREISVDQLKYYKDNQLLLLVAGSQGQENSAMARIANGEHKDIKLTAQDTVIFSSDPIPGNEVLVNSLIDEIAKKGVAVLYSRIHDFLHVSGHGSQDELTRLMQLTRPKKLIPIGGNSRHMALYKNLAKEIGYKDSDVALLEDGQEVVFTKDSFRFGKRIPVKKVFVDEISGEEVESYVLRDRQKLSESGIVIVMTEIDSTTGQLVTAPDIIVRGFLLENKKLNAILARELNKAFSKKSGLVSNWVYVRKLVGEIAERIIFRHLRRRPLVLPVVIEV